MRSIPKRFWKPLGIAWAATLTAIGLATVPNFRGVYDPNLAVLTLTLIAVIWYTYFNYRSVHREPSGYLQVQLSYESTFETVNPIIQNPTERTLDVRLILDIWADGQRVEMDPFYSGGEVKRVDRTQGFRGAVELKDIIKIRRDAYNAPISGAKELLVRFTATWTDDLGESGSTLPIYKRIEPLQNRQHDLVAPSEINKYFGRLPGFSMAKVASAPSPALWTFL
jgi:hypothetical protein